MGERQPPSRLRSSNRAGRAPRAGRRNIYVSEEDVPVWSEAEQYAREHHVSLSSLIADALARYLANPPAP